MSDYQAAPAPKPCCGGLNGVHNLLRCMADHPPGPCGNYVSDLHLAGPCVRESGHRGAHGDGSNEWTRSVL